MKTFRYTSALVAIAGTVLSVSYLTALFGQQQPPADPTPALLAPEEVQPVPADSMEVQTSGPIHEAFATPLTEETPQPIVVDKQPPERIEELPPEEMPAGTNVVWIPGYFGWDEQRGDFIWISGFWRDVPPGRVWVSGYWTEASDGWQWVPGFWTSAETKEISYLPEPPEPLEAGPPIAQPSENHFWVPGHWSWNSNQYLWRAGYWSRIQPNWVWVPAHYVWCPSGYVFIDGYWDLPVALRGLLFAPVYFQPVVYTRPYYYTPTICWSSRLLTTHLWVRPRYYHYYFGDYYDDRFANWGIRPWFTSYTIGQVSYDPLFSYYRWYYRDRDWARQVQTRYDFYRRNRDYRPPRTYREMQQIVARTDNRNIIRDTVVAAPITQIVNNTTVNNTTIINNRVSNVAREAVRANFDTPFRFERVDRQERRQMAREADEIRSIVRERRKLETRDNVARVEGPADRNARKGDDQRARRPAPRSLDISEAVKAIDTAAERNRDVRRRAGGDVAGGRTDERRNTGRGRDMTRQPETATLPPGLADTGGETAANRRDATSRDRGRRGQENRGAASTAPGTNLDTQSAPRARDVARPDLTAPGERAAQSAAADRARRAAETTRDARERAQRRAAERAAETGSAAARERGSPPGRASDAGRGSSQGLPGTRGPALGPPTRTETRDRTAPAERIRESAPEVRERARERATRGREGAALPPGLATPRGGGPATSLGPANPTEAQGRLRRPDRSPAPTLPPSAGDIGRGSRAAFPQAPSRAAVERNIPRPSIQPGPRPDVRSRVDATAGAARAAERARAAQESARATQERVRAAQERAKNQNAAQPPGQAKGRDKRDRD